MNRRSEADKYDEALRLRDMDAAEVRRASLTIVEHSRDTDELRTWLFDAIRPEVRCTTPVPAESRAVPRWEK